MAKSRWLRIQSVNLSNRVFALTLTLYEGTKTGRLRICYASGEIKLAADSTVNRVFALTLTFGFLQDGDVGIGVFPSFQRVRRFL